MHSLQLTLIIFHQVALAQATAAPVPAKHIPPTVLMELRSLENQFDLALSRDCAPERCTSKGCVYQDHVVVDLPRNSSLPGLNQPEGLGAVPPQEYLTQAHCDFAHEKNINPRDVQALSKRLEQRLSKGWLQVTVGRQILEPIAESLRESPPEKVKPEPPKPEVPPVVPAAPPPPQKWEAEVALRELWVSLLPHFWWMVGLFLLSLAIMVFIWSLRRVGRESLEEKLMLNQLQGDKGAAQVNGEPPAPPVIEKKPDATQSVEALAQQAFISAQQKRWSDRIATATAQSPENHGVMTEILRDWLKTRRYDLLAKATLEFGDQLSQELPVDGEFAQRKVEFAQYLEEHDASTLPSDADFFRALNRQAISSSVLSQTDAGSFAGLREEFGASGLVQLIQSLPIRHGALLFGMVSTDSQQEVALLLPEELRIEVASQLLASRRISRDERDYLFATIDAARAGKALPKPPAASAHETVDRGQEFDAASAVSLLLTHIAPRHRQNLFQEALERSNGVFPLWYEEILYSDMLMKLPGEARADVLLDVDAKRLAAWVAGQNAAWQQTFLAAQPATMQNVLRANMAFGSRAEQQRLARLGQQELTSSLKRAVSQGRVSFAEILA